jgi:AcrR family transcriptional regulator
MAMGRPREFDVDAALDAALQVFWSKGYEGTTIADLTEAMKLKRGSIYAAYGSKEQLFRRALDRYSDTVASYGTAALTRPAIRAVVEDMLRGAAQATTGADTPAGCLIVHGALVAGDESCDIREELATRRLATLMALRERFERAAAEGDLPPDVHPGTAADYVSTVVDGVAVMAASGVDRAQLENMIELVLGRLPWE